MIVGVLIYFVALGMGIGRNMDWQLFTDICIYETMEKTKKKI